MTDAARTLLWLARDLERRGYAYCGVLRQVAREVATGQPAREDGGCERCGGEVMQPWTGRPRKFCYSCSPQRKTPGKRQDAA